MTIQLGTAVPSNYNGQFVLVLTAPKRFDTVDAVRLTNVSSVVIVLNNISSCYQGQELLMPGQQMVYKSPNVSSVPYAYSSQAATAALEGLLLSEWSDDSATDFIGTYPASVSTLG
jgi:hypothetical protein